MIVYRDLLSGDEMITDAFKLLPVVDKEGNTVRMMTDYAKKKEWKKDQFCVNCFSKRLNLSLFAYLPTPFDNRLKVS